MTFADQTRVERLRVLDALNIQPGRGAFVTGPHTGPDTGTL